MGIAVISCVQYRTGDSSVPPLRCAVARVSLLSRRVLIPEESAPVGGRRVIPHAARSLGTREGGWNENEAIGACRVRTVDDDARVDDRGNERRSGAWRRGVENQTGV